MKVIVPGLSYELPNFENKDEAGQKLQFIHKQPKEEGSTELITVDGTTNEDVLDVLIDRLNVQNAKFPCKENSIAITKLEEAKMWLHKRTADRVARNVEGKHKN
jgi:hypothetical protein